MAITPKVIRIKKVFNNDRKFVILDEQDVRYEGWKDWEGEPTEVYNQFTAGGFKEGDTVLVNYKSSEKNGKVYHNLTGVFRHGVSAPSTAPTTSTKPQPPTNENREAFGKRLAIHGMVNGMLASGRTPAEVRDALPSLLALEEAIEKALIDGKPEMKIESDEIDVEDIPF